MRKGFPLRRVNAFMSAPLADQHTMPVVDRLRIRRDTRLSTSALRRAIIAIVYKTKSPDVGLTIPVSSISKSATLSPLVSPLTTVMSLAVPG